METETMNREDTLQIELNQAEMETISGGSPFEDIFADTALYRAGVSIENVCFGSDRYYVGSQKIEKELARTLRSRSTELWESKYAATADFVGYLREWKQTMAKDYGISWNGLLGTYAAKVW